uniref:Uncharacterized protein n=1 Tax=Arundo donax TaxID=35708 RepID=A0A0A9DPC0_ARUDO
MLQGRNKCLHIANEKQDIGNKRITGYSPHPKELEAFLIFLTISYLYTFPSKTITTYRCLLTQPFQCENSCLQKHRPHMLNLLIRNP